MSEERMTKEDATDFFAEFYKGEHHIPGKLYEWGLGWRVNHNRGDLATFDYDDLTQLVLMAHDKCCRVSISPHNFNTVKICVWKRQREGQMSIRHPTLEQVVEKYNQRKDPKP